MIKFLKRLLEIKPLSLPDLFELNSREGIYRGQILNALKDKVVFLGLREQPNGPVKFEEYQTPMWIVQSPDNRGVFLIAFLDQKSLKLQNPSAFPYMVDFRTISKIMDHPQFLGLIVGSNNQFLTFLKPELIKRGLISDVRISS
jgi:hypothetical protein